MTKDISKLSDRQNMILFKHFNQIQEQLSRNLKKLHLGVIFPTIMKILERIFSEEMKKMIESTNSNKKDFENALKIGFKKIIDNYLEVFENIER